MNKERELLQKILTDNDDENYFISCKVYKEIEELLAQPEQEPEQEPVAWMWTRKYGHGGYTDKVFQFLCDAEECAKDSQDLKRPDIITPLYTAPPTRQPLDNVEIMTIAAEHTWDLKSFARAIEKAHGIGLDE